MLINADEVDGSYFLFGTIGLLLFFMAGNAEFLDIFYILLLFVY